VDEPWVEKLDLGSAELASVVPQKDVLLTRA
jgi:hypothetical protein